MALLWTTPRVWDVEEPITREKLNEISNNLTYLAQPSQALVTVRGTASDIAITSTTPVDIDLATYQVSLGLSGAFDVEIQFTGVANNANLAAINRFDFYIDNGLYASSLTGTVLASGVSSYTQYVAANLVPVNIVVVIPAGVLGAGVHTFQPRAWVSAGTLTWRMSTGWFSQFRVREH